MTPEEIAKALEKIEKRISELEQKQNKIDAILNKAAGATAVIVLVGSIIGWLLWAGGNIFGIVH